MEDGETAMKLRARANWLGSFWVDIRMGRPDRVLVLMEVGGSADKVFLSRVHMGGSVDLRADEIYDRGRFHRLIRSGKK
jgi:hypothetical protein